MNNCSFVMKMRILFWIGSFVKWLCNASNLGTQYIHKFLELIYVASLIFESKDNKTKENSVFSP